MQDAVGEGPVVFFTSKGRQVVYDVGAVKFDRGVPKVPTADPEDQAALTEWLEELVKEGRLSPAPDATPEPVALLELEAKQPGPTFITVDVADGGVAGEVDVTVTWSFTYPDLTLDGLEGALGSSTNPATNVGLVQLKELPANAEDPVDAGPNPPANSVWEFAGVHNPSFTLEPRAAVGPTEAERIEVEVEVTGMDASGTKAIFELTVTWVAEIEHVTSSTLGRIQGEAGFAIKAAVTPGVAALPALGTSTLVGGTETVVTTKATATILSQA